MAAGSSDSTITHVLLRVKLIVCKKMSPALKSYVGPWQHTTGSKHKTRLRKWVVD